MHKGWWHNGNQIEEEELEESFTEEDKMRLQVKELMLSGRHHLKNSRKKTIFDRQQSVQNNNIIKKRKSPLNISR